MFREFYSSSTRGRFPDYIKNRHTLALQRESKEVHILT